MKRRLVELEARAERLRENLLMQQIEWERCCALTDWNGDGLSDDVPRHIAGIINTPLLKRTTEQKTTIRAYYLEQDMIYAGLTDRIEQLRKKLEATGPGERDPRAAQAARAAVHRCWAELFGRDPTATATAGDPDARPRLDAHTGLVDRLAAELIDSGWSMRRLVRWIVTSAAYQGAVGGLSRCGPDDLTAASHHGDDMPPHAR